MAGVGTILKQAKKMQKAMEEIQAGLENEQIEVSNGGGAVKVMVNGHGVLKSLKIDSEFLKEDVQSVEETILQTINDACAKAKSVSEERMGQATGGFNIPGIPGLF